LTDIFVPRVTPQFLHPWTIWRCGPEARLHGSTVAPASMTVTANLAVYVPFSIPWPYPVKRVFWYNGSVVASAHCDFGIYSPQGGLIYRTGGSVVQSGASAPQYTTPSPNFILDPGDYYMGWVWAFSTKNDIKNYSFLLEW